MFASTWLLSPQHVQKVLCVCVYGVVLGRLVYYT